MLSVRENVSFDYNDLCDMAEIFGLPAGKVQVDEIEDWLKIIWLDKSEVLLWLKKEETIDLKTIDRDLARKLFNLCFIMRDALENHPSKKEEFVFVFDVTPREI